jgi:hypothetical protein
MNQERILIISYSDLSKDPRVIRQYQALKEKYVVEFLAYAPIKGTETSFRKINTYPSFSLTRKIYRFFLFLLRFYEGFYWDITKLNLVKELNKNRYDVIISNDIMSLPLAIKIKIKLTKVLFDAHEYHFEEFGDNFIWNIFYKPYVKFLCTKYIPQADSFITVSEPISDLYYKVIGIRPDVLSNAADFFDLQPFNCIGNSKIRLIHHGAAISSRKIENMIKLLDYLDERFELYLMLVPTDETYLDKLIKFKRQYKNLYFIEPTNYQNIIPSINRFDIGIYILEPTNMNNKLSLPNKLFEFIQARLMLIVSNNISMKQIVESNSIGLVCDSYSSELIAKQINNLTHEEIMRYKYKSHDVAKVISSNSNKIKLQGIIKDLID